MSVHLDARLRGHEEVRVGLTRFGRAAVVSLPTRDRGGDETRAFLNILLMPAQAGIQTHRRRHLAPAHAASRKLW